MPVGFSVDDLAEWITDLLEKVEEDCPEEFRSLRLRRLLEQGRERLRELHAAKPRLPRPEIILGGGLSNSAKIHEPRGNPESLPAAEKATLRKAQRAIKAVSVDAGDKRPGKSRYPRRPRRTAES